MRKRLVDIFLKVANKMITRMRAGKRLSKIRKWLQSKKIANREDCKRMVTEDWRDSLNAQGVGGADDDVEVIDNVRYAFSFSKKNLLPDMKLPLEYETNIASFMEKIDATPVINFDDLEPFEHIE